MVKGMGFRGVRSKLVVVVSENRVREGVEQPRENARRDFFKLAVSVSLPVVWHA